jgi:aminoglycoside phosphotransferase (APT) family kinase protein
VGEPVGWLTTGSVRDLRSALAQVVPELADRPVVLNDRIVTADPRFFQGSAIVDGSFLVKFAWAEPPARRIVHEGRVLAALGGSPGRLAVPTVVARAAAPALLVSRLIAGEPLSWEAANELGGPRRQRLVADLARFLVALHDPATLAAVRAAGIALDVPEPQATTAEIRARLGSHVRSSQRAIVEDWCNWVDVILAGPAEAVFLQGDLHGYNLVWDRASGALPLVADFEWAGVGDPEFDFRYLPGQADTTALFVDVARLYAELRGRELDLERVMAWHIRTVLGDALWRTEAGVPLPGSGGTASSWVDELQTRMRAVIER